MNFSHKFHFSSLFILKLRSSKLEKLLYELLDVVIPYAELRKFKGRTLENGQVVWPSCFFVNNYEDYARDNTRANDKLNTGHGHKIFELGGSKLYDVVSSHHPTPGWINAFNVHQNTLNPNSFIVRIGKMSGMWEHCPCPWIYGPPSLPEEQRVPYTIYVSWIFELLHFHNFMWDYHSSYISKKFEYFSKGD